MNDRNVFVIFGLLLVCWLVFYRCTQKKGLLEGLGGYAFNTNVNGGYGSQTHGYKPYLGEKGKSCNDVCSARGMQCNQSGLQDIQTDTINNEVRNLIKNTYGQKLRNTEDIVQNGRRLRDGFELGRNMPDAAKSLPGVWVHSDNVGEIVRKNLSLIHI